MVEEIVGLWLLPDCAQPALGLGVGRVAADRFAEGGLGPRRVAAHQDHVAAKDGHPGRVGIEFFVQPEQGQRVIELVGARETERGSVERYLAEVVRAASVVALAQGAVGADRRVAARRGGRLHHVRSQRHRARDPAMAGGAGGLECRRAGARQGVQPPVDLLEHQHHLSRHQFRALRVADEVELLERLSLLPHVTVLASDAQVAGEVAHDPDDLDHGGVVRNDPRVHQRIGGELAGGLRRGKVRQGDERGNGDGEAHQTSCDGVACPTESFGRWRRPPT
jgi:hypothetical protein